MLEKENTNFLKADFQILKIMAMAQSKAGNSMGHKQVRLLWGNKDEIATTYIQMAGR